jgi:hypothetical protein
MGLIIDIVTAKIKQGAILPTFEIEVRAIHQDNPGAFFATAMCEVLLGEEIRSYEELTYIASLPALINQNVPAQGHFRFSFNLSLTQEIMYQIKRQTIEGRDLSFYLNVMTQMFDIATASQLERGRYASGSNRFVITYNDWVKVVTKKLDRMLIPVSPETYAKLQSLLSTYRPLKSIEELVAELADQNTKEPRT